MEIRAYIATVMLLLAEAASADVVDIANEVRGDGCQAQRPVETPLRRDSALDAAARLVARGAELPDALMQASYRASRSKLINIAGAADDAAIREVLADGFCDDVSSAAYLAAGAYERGRAFWLLLATPFATPAPSRANNVEQRVLELVNEARVAGRRCGRRRFEAVRPLTLSDVLTRAAAVQAADMAANDFMGHSGSDGSTAGERVTRAGYRWRSVGENVAAGHPDADAVVEGWLESPEHCANIMSSLFTEMGVAFVPAPRTELRIFWSQVFAARR